MLLFLVRHGVTQHNTDRIFMGHDPVPLSPKGREQIRRLAERLGTSPPTRIVSSDIRRAQQSAEIIAQRLRLPIETSAELREVDVGEAKGFSYAEAAERWPHVFVPDGQGRFPRGESFADVYQRASGIMEELLNVHAGQSILVVGHHVVHRTYLAGLLGLSLDQARQVTLDNCGISVVVHDGDKALVSTLNAAFHLQGVAAA